MRSRSQLLSLVLTRTVFALGIAYILLNLGRAIQTNYTTSQQIRTLKQEITRLTNHTAYLKNTIVYYKSRTYQELEAKRRLGLQRPGETVVLVPGNTDPEPTTVPAVRSDVSTKESPPTAFEQASTNALTWTRWFQTPLGHSN
ncbi:MAG: septum formation initiator family protein [Patescibacteria group bacterium]